MISKKAELARLRAEPDAMSDFRHPRSNDRAPRVATPRSAFGAGRKERVVGFAFGELRLKSPSGL